VEKAGWRIRSITLTNGERLAGKAFIDASNKGDLMAKAGVGYTCGREAKAEFDEPLAGVLGPPFRMLYDEDYLGKPGAEYTHHGQFLARIPARDKCGKPYWRISSEPQPVEGSADKRVQANCCRLIATQREDLRVPWPKPRRYEPERYELLLRYLQVHPNISFARLVHFAAIPDGKYDLNASGPFSIDYVGGNLDYPDGDYPARDRMFADHMAYQQGFLWFLGHDARVPKQLRDEVNSWGLCRAEYPDTAHWPVQLYIREARRMRGAYVMTEHDILSLNTNEDSIGMGSFVLDSHWMKRHEDEMGNVAIEGHLDESIQLAQRPYEIPYQSITPLRKDCQNLLVPACLSATHVAICTIRMEPMYMMMGHAAGLAAANSARTGQAVQDLGAAALTKELREQGAVLHKAEARKVP